MCWELLSSWLLRYSTHTTVLHSACLFTLAQQFLGLEALTCVDNLTMDLTRWIVMVSWMRRNNTSLVLVYVKSIVGEKRYMWFGDKWKRQIRYNVLCVGISLPSMTTKELSCNKEMMDKGQRRSSCLWMFYTNMYKQSHTLHPSDIHP